MFILYGIEISTQSMVLFNYSLKYTPNCYELSIVFQRERNKY